VNKERKKLSDFARDQGMAYISVYKLWRNGHIEGVQLPSGTILVSGWKKKSSHQETNRAIIYVRIPTVKQKSLLNEQVKTLTEYSERKGYKVLEIIEEVGYGFVGDRQKLLEILSRTDWDVLVVDNKEIPIKFGFDYLNASLEASGRMIDYKTNLDSSAEKTLISLFSNMNHLLKSLIGIGQKRQMEAAIDRIAS
jgi:predicted site-specific integrase-resolvase